MKFDLLYKKKRKNRKKTFNKIEGKKKEKQENCQ